MEVIIFLSHKIKGFPIRAGRYWNGIKQTVCEVLTKLFFLFEMSMNAIYYEIWHRLNDHRGFLLWTGSGKIFLFSKRNNLYKPTWKVSPQIKFLCNISSTYFVFGVPYFKRKKNNLCRITPSVQSLSVCLSVVRCRRSVKTLFLKNSWQY